MTPIIDIRNLGIGFAAGNAGDTPPEPAVRGVDISVSRGEILGVVGESGSGKSLTALALMHLLPPGARVLSGTMLLDGEDLTDASEERMRSLRGRRVSMLFQDPQGSFNPLHRVGRQIGEALAVHRRWKPERIRVRVAELLCEVGMDDHERFMRAFPHQLSGGQRQRAMLAMALANEPDVLIADEPTTALDAEVQQQVVDLLLRLREARGLSMLVISHDLPMMHRLADRVCVMRKGEVVEHGPAARIFGAPQHPYTRLLMDTGGDEPAPEPAMEATPVIDVCGLNVSYPVGTNWLGRAKRRLHAVRNASFSVARGESLAVVGESGSGKSSLGLAVTRLIASEGDILFAGARLDGTSSKRMRPLRRKLQIVFQSPLGALNPRLSVRDCIAEGLEARPGPGPKEVDARVAAVMREVELDPAMRHRYPHEFSGGQCQRICIARALVMEPDCIVFDEPTSSLDRSTQFQVVDLLRGLHRTRGLASLFITHDLALVARLCHRVMIMRDGCVIETGRTRDVFRAPGHAYTRRLLAAAMPYGNQTNDQGEIR